MQNEPMMRMPLELLRYDLHQLELDFERRLSRCQAGAVAEPENMRVDGNGRLAKGAVDPDMGGLGADAGELFERCALARDFAAIFVDQDLRQRHHVPGLRSVETDGADMRDELLFAESQHLCGRVGEL